MAVEYALTAWGLGWGSVSLGLRPADHPQTFRHFRAALFTWHAFVSVIVSPHMSPSTLIIWRHPLMEAVPWGYALRAVHIVHGQARHMSLPRGSCVGRGSFALGVFLQRWISWGGLATPTEMARH